MAGPSPWLSTLICRRAFRLIRSPLIETSIRTNGGTSLGSNRNMTWMKERTRSLVERLSLYDAYTKRMHHLPDLVRRIIEKAYALRLRPGPTSLLGPRHRRSRDLVEIDITYACNLDCFNCDRSCHQAPSGDHMSLGQILYFLDETRLNRIQWRRISVLGGEPTLHPQFQEIMKLILEYCEKYSPHTRVVVVTNGYGDRVNNTLIHLPARVKVRNTAKKSQIQRDFNTFNVAPVDVQEYAGADFSNGCWITEGCGMGVTPYGYYPCAVAGGIDRIFGFDLGRSTLPEPDDDMEQQLRAFCTYCGHFKLPTAQPLVGSVMSPAWSLAYARSRREPVVLSRLPEAATWR